MTSDSEPAKTDIRFYHLQDFPIERALPDLLEKSLERGWRVVVQAASEERVEALDAHLWTYREDGFLPHGTEHGPEPAMQPILLTTSARNPNDANVRFLIDGAPLPEDAATYLRIVLLFDGDDAEALAVARAQWAAVKASGGAATYWQRDAAGRWAGKG